MMKRPDGLDPYSATWMGLKQMVAAEIARELRQIAVPGTSERKADELRGRIGALDELLALEKAPAPAEKLGSPALDPRLGY